MSVEEIKVPEVGESITEGILAEWMHHTGDFVRADNPLFVLETDKVTMEVNSEHSGRVKALVDAGETVKVGQVVAKVDTEAEAPKADDQGGKSEDQEEAKEADSDREDAEGTERDEAAEPESEKDKEEKEETKAEADRKRPDALAPSVRRLVAEHRLNPEEIEGTGRGGRITKEDVMRHLSESEEETEAEPEPQRKAGPRPVTPMPARSKPESEGQEDDERRTRTTMSPLRKRIAERLVQAQQTAAILTTFNEVDMTNVMQWRTRYKEAFKEKHETGLGFMSFFIKASVDALKAVPALNAQIDGDEIVQNHFYDIGVAVSTERGLVVPVIRDADQLSFAEIELAVADLAGRAQEKKLTLDELSGGCFTITNGGVFGSLLSTPILNPPQSGILGMHGIKKRPVAVGDAMEIRPMMYLALSYDHRIVDGKESVTFLKRIVECIENPERMMLQI